MAHLLSVRLPRERPRAVVFDMDGLMFDSERVDREIWREVAARRGHEFPDSVHDLLVGRGRIESDRVLTEHFGETFPLAEARAETQNRWAKRVKDEGLPHKTGLMELIEYLESIAMPIAVSTSTARHKALLCLGTLAKRFDALAFGDEVTHPKPAPDLYLLAASRMGVAPTACLALEDSPTGFAAAQAAGMTTVLIPDLVAPTVLPQFVCRTLSDVAQWLREVTGGLGP